MAGEDTPPPAPTSDNLKEPLLPLHDPIQETPNTSITITSILNLKNFYIILGPLLSLVICFLVKLDAPETSQKMLGVIAWVFTWWITKAVPLPVTSMCPLFLFPVFGIASADSVAHSYMDDVITLVLGSFILALAVERYNVHRRLALNVSYLPTTLFTLLNKICCSKFATFFYLLFVRNIRSLYR